MQRSCESFAWIGLVFSYSYIYDVINILDTMMRYNTFLVSRGLKSQAHISDGSNQIQIDSVDIVRKVDCNKYII
jgi:hypothetical protein